jgi:hypothetical protein
MKTFLAILIWIVALIAFNSIYWERRGVDRYKSVMEYYTTAFKDLRDDRSVSEYLRFIASINIIHV